MFLSVFLSCLDSLVICVCVLVELLVLCFSLIFFLFVLRFVKGRGEVLCVWLISRLCVVFSR